MKDSLSITHPYLAAQWHPTKNGVLTPDRVLAGSEKKVWWKCTKDPEHEWDAFISNRAKKVSGCPYCAGKKPSAKRCLASLYPEIAKQWHPIKNGKLTPEQVTAGSDKKVWWKCTKGPDHEWDASILSRTKKEPGYPFCAGRRPSATRCLAKIL